MRSFVIRNDGSTEVLQLREFAELQRECGGMARQVGSEELVWQPGRTVESPSILAEQIEHLTMWANEEGRIYEMPANVVATMVVGWPLMRETVIVGDVVITGPTDRAGNRTALSDHDLELLERRAARATELLRQREAE
jgi:hypothetical protein